MDIFQALVRGVLWLARRDWGLAFLLALTSFWTIVALPGPRFEALFEGSVFKAGIYLGTLIFPNYGDRGTNGFYLVPLFGAAADFLMLMAFWFVVVRFIRTFRAKKENLGQP